MILNSIIKKRKIVYIVGDDKKEVSGFLNFVLRNKLSVYHLRRLPTNFDIVSILRSNIIVIEDSEKVEVDKIKGFLKDFSSIFIITEAKKKNRIKKFLNNFEKNWDIVLDFSIAKKLKRRRGKQHFTFAVDKKKADFNITNIHRQDNETNFKINYEGNSIPFWIEKKLSRKEVYFILPALCVAQIMKLNLAEISYKIREKWPFADKGQLVT